jgi:hypothetical protein
MALTLGSVVGVPGRTVRGTHPLLELATAPGSGAGLEELAVVVITAADAAPGDPRVLITANIHGPEICPTIVACAPLPPVARAPPFTPAHAPAEATTVQQALALLDRGLESRAGSSAHGGRHRLIERAEVALAAGELTGTVVVYPSLNPTGHRGAHRHPQFEVAGTDPNRMVRPAAD